MTSLISKDRQCRESSGTESPLTENPIIYIIYIIYVYNMVNDEEWPSLPKRSA